MHAHVVRHADGLALYHIDVELYQSASLETDASLVTASTWSVGVRGSVGSAHLATIRQSVSDGVDRFITASRSVHPRPAGSPAPSDD